MAGDGPKSWRSIRRRRALNEELVEHYKRLVDAELRGEAGEAGRAGWIDDAGEAGEAGEESERSEPPVPRLEEREHGKGEQPDRG